MSSNEVKERRVPERSEGIADLVRPDLADLKPYVVKDVPHRIKMDANENPFDMPDQIRELIAEELRRHPFNRYPDPAARDCGKVRRERCIP